MNNGPKDEDEEAQERADQELEDEVNDDDAYPPENMPDGD